MNCNWPQVKLGDVVEITSSKRVKMADYVEKGVPFFRSKEVIERYKGNAITTELYITEEHYQTIKDKFGAPEEGHILLTSVGTLGIPYQVQANDKFYFKDGNLTWFKEFGDAIDAEFLFYWLTSPIAKRKFDEITIGSTQKALTIVALKGIEIDLPPKTIQKQVVKIVKSLDRKLSNNRGVNQTLEQMAQAIFKSWFVDFDPVKAKMNGEQPEGMDAATASLFPEKLDSETGLPEGWKLSEIGDEVTVVGGGTPSKKNDDFWVDGHIHWTSPKDLSGVQDKVLLDTASKVTEAGLKKISSGLLPVDTVLLSSRAPVGYLALAKVSMAINQGYIAMKCEKQLPPEFVIQWCVHRMDEIKQRASGSTFAEISKKSFKPISVVVPSEDTLNAYQKIVKPLYDAITSNARQNEQLSSLRDTLLPKLLSGELSISD
ncbi:restriction endonuclease subunit S [Vibrio metschnikovii]|uniref:restriction endonuclease subunit S n=2 Tax=Vibrio TaxID=662 RepID=UPI002FC6ED7F